MSKTTQSQYTSAWRKESRTSAKFLQSARLVTLYHSIKGASASGCFRQNPRSRLLLIILTDALLLQMIPFWDRYVKSGGLCLITSFQGGDEVCDVCISQRLPELLHDLQPRSLHVFHDLPL